MDTTKIMDKITELGVTYGTKIIGAVAVLIIGGWIVKLISKGFNKMLDKRKVEDSLRPFLKSLIGTMLKILLVITVLTMLGVEMTSFIALLGAAGLAIGMALSGTLQNFAGGVMILIFKPFKVGDFIAAQGYEGTVTEIQVFNTIILTLDHKKVIIPNGGLSNSVMTNFTHNPVRRVDWTVGIGYGDDVDKAREVILNLVKSDPNVLTEPEDVFVEVEELGDSSVNFTVRAWTRNENYWDVYFRLNKEVYKNFAKEGLNIPFPQMDVHVHKAD
jgi:small conductance mechanosensitive channel